jgi:hypothetical protein
MQNWWENVNRLCAFVHTYTQSYVNSYPLFSKIIMHTVTRVTQWHCWLRHCATSWKVAVLIANGVTGIFHWHNPYGCTVALGFTHSLTEMSTTFMCWLSWNLGASTSWNPIGLSRPVMGLLYLHLYFLQASNYYMMVNWKNSGRWQ